MLTGAGEVAVVAIYLSQDTVGLAGKGKIESYMRRVTGTFS